MKVNVGSHVRKPQVETARVIANHVNGTKLLRPPWRSREQARTYGAWRAADAILGPSLPRIDASTLAHETVRRFNRLAEATGVAPRIAELRTHVQPHYRVTHVSLTYRDPAVGFVVERMWQLFVTGGCTRLRLCGKCGRWFADGTKNNRQMWCSARCRDRAWNRERRRKSKLRGSKRRMKRRRAT
jgi:hypothetical protein